MPLFITNIQRCSFHDGPGIRTTVFLKGCSLRCFWCHNPETLHSGYGLRYISSRCIQCEACVEACRQASGLDCRSPWQLVEYAKTQDGCSGCGQCVSCCPSQALVSTAKAYEREELLPLLLADRAYYESSGGGVPPQSIRPEMSPGKPLSRCWSLKREGRICSSLT